MVSRFSNSNDGTFDSVPANPRCWFTARLQWAFHCPVVQMDVSETVVQNFKQTLFSIACCFAFFVSSTFAQDRPSIEKMVEKLDTKNDPTTVIQALHELRELGPKAVSRIDAILPMLKDTRSDYSTQLRVTQEAAKTLKAIGEPAVKRVIREIKTTEDAVTYHAMALAIHTFGDDAKSVGPFLNKQLKEATGQKQFITMHALAALGKQAVPSIPIFAEALNSKDFHLQSMGCDCLGAVAAHEKLPKETIEQILLLLEDGVVSTRMHAARSLGSIGVVDGFDVVDSLMTATEERQAMVRNAALHSLGQIGADSRKVVPKLRKLMNDPDYRNGVEAARAVWLISGDANESVDRLLEIIDDVDYEIECIDTLAEMKGDSAKAIPRLTKFLSSKDPDLRMQSVRAIGRIGTTDEKVLKAVEELKSDKDADVRKSAAVAFGCLLYTSPSPRDATLSRMPSSA